MKVVITGGFGFLGLHLCKRLLAIGELTSADDEKKEVKQVILFDLGEAKDVPEDPRLRIVTGDITDASECEKLIDEDGMVIFHLASVMSGEGETDFDVCCRVNLEGTRNLLEVCRKRVGCKFIFASSGACFGERPEGPETDLTKFLPSTSYGMTKACCELMINDYTRRNFLDGRVARLPTVIPRPERNSGLPAAFSDVLREPLLGKDCVLNLPPDMPHAVCGYRVLVRNLLHLADLPAAAFADSTDRSMNLPCLSLTLQQLYEALQSLVPSARLGKVSYEPDVNLTAKLKTFHRNMLATRARSMGMVADSSAAAIAADFAAQYVDAGMLKDIVEIYEEPRHWMTFSNEHLRVFRVENAPVDTTLTHIHRVDSLYFFFSESQVQGTKWKEEPKDDVLQDGEVRYGDHGTSCTLIHKIHNKSRPVMMCLDVEFAGFHQEPPAKRPKMEPPSISPPLKLIKERPAVRVYTIDVAAGSSCSCALPFAKVLLVVHRGARIRGTLGECFVKAGDVFFREGPEEMKLEVLGSRRDLRLWVVELLY